MASSTSQARERRENRRLGRITIPDAVRTMPPQFGSIFEGMIPLDIDHDWITHRLIYVCWSKQFRSIGDTEVVPFYVGRFDGARWVFTERPTP